MQHGRPYKVLGAAFTAGLLWSLGMFNGELPVTSEPAASWEDFNYGYRPDPVGTKAFLQELDRPLFSDAGEDVIKKSKGVDTFLYRPAVEGFRELYGKEWVVEKQGIGDCVSWAWAHSAWIASSVDWSEGEIGEPPAFPCTEAIYGGSRCEARGRDYAGFSDGSYGAAAARWLKDWGVLSRGQYEDFDLREYSSKRAKDWGAYGAGGKGNTYIDDLAKKHPATAVALVTSFEEAAAAIESGFPVAVCSGQGFSKSRDAQGFCRPQGSWAHAMCFCSVRYGDRPGLLCLNSWGPNWVDGPRWPEDMPEGSFWVDKETVNKMLGRYEDSFAVGGVTGFKWRDLHHGKWLGAEQ